jgi:hypothetical protein
MKIAKNSDRNIDTNHQLLHLWPWRRGAVDIASASRTKRPGFEFRQGIRFLGKHSSAVVYKIT